MQHSTTTRRLTRVTTAHKILRLISASLIGAACAEDSPVQPTARVPAGGPKTVALVVNLLPTGDQFPAKIGYFTGSPVGEPPKIQVYDAYGNLMLRFQAFTDPWNMMTGAEATIGDINGDGWADIITSEGPSQPAIAGPRFIVWDGRLASLLAVRR